VIDKDESQWQEAARLRQEHPAWLVIWLASAGQYRAYSRVNQGRHEKTLCADTPDDLATLIRQAEQATPTRRSDSKD
jgi:hypothetical protein